MISGLKYFSIDEFKCKCCGKVFMNATFLAMLDNAREFAEVPFIITSGYRCEKHNAEIGSTSKNHTSGRAADIACSDGPTRIKIIAGLIRAGFRRIGVAKTFIHCDSVDSIESMWLY